LPAFSDGADRNYSAESDCRSRRGRGGRAARQSRHDAGVAWALEFIQGHTADDYLSSRLSVAKPIALGKTQGLGRHASSPGTTRNADQRETAKLFSLVSIATARERGIGVGRGRQM